MPSLPPKTKNTPEPDYEIIEFSQQQYLNEPMKTTQIRVKTPGKWKASERIFIISWGKSTIIYISYSLIAEYV